MNDKIKPIVVIDTQLILRATLNPKSLPARILFQMKDAYLLVVSPEVRAEAQDVLTRPALRAKFPQLNDDEVARTLAVLDEAVQVVPETVESVSRDPKDDKFLALAVDANAQYIVTEDKDLLVLDPYRAIRLLNALDFVRVLQDFDSLNQQ